MVRGPPLCEIHCSVSTYFNQLLSLEACQHEATEVGEISFEVSTFDMGAWPQQVAGFHTRAGYYASEWNDVSTIYAYESPGYVFALRATPGLDPYATDMPSQEHMQDALEAAYEHLIGRADPMLGTQLGR